MVGRRISAARATIWMTGRKTSGYGSFRLGKGLSNLTRTEHRPLFGQVLKNDDTRRYSPAGVFVPIRVDSLGSCWAGPLRRWPIGLYAGTLSTIHGTMQGGRIIASGKTGRAWKSGVHLHIDLKQRRLRNVCCEVANVSLSCQGERVAPNAFSRA